MASVIIMPKQGQSVESCIITQINKKKGDKVLKGDILFAYETDKATFEEESPVEGVILEVFVSEGDEVPVLTNILVIGVEGENIDGFLPGVKTKPAVAESLKAETSKTVKQQKINNGKNASPEGDRDMHGEKGSFVSPRARKLADEKAIKSKKIKGTGPGGRILERDIMDFISNNPPLTPLARKLIKDDESLDYISGTGLAQTVNSNDLSKTPGEDEFEIKPLSNIRKLIAKTMLFSLQNSAQLTHHLSADASRIKELRKKIKEATDAGYLNNITLNDMICFAAVRAIKKYPQINAHLTGDFLKYFKKVHLGFAVDTDRGLMVPVIKNADDLTIQELSNQFKEIAAACHKGNIDPDLLSPEAASFTVSNLGNYGVEMFTPIINLPQVAILGVNTIVLRPVEINDGKFNFAPYLGLSITYDHRALDGGDATRFVKQVAIEIENLEIDLPPAP
jgi:pyruvate dehydrogenase E2 component (dihydrolipoamide acetyltransferase)